MTAGDDARAPPKPGDHPDFFRLPPPPGRSRESSIVLSKEGRFFHEGAPVEHPGMQRAFAAWLTRHPDDGRYILSNGYDWSYITVEGPARFVHSVRNVSGRPLLVLLDGSELPLEPALLRVDSAGRLSVMLPGGEPAAFTPAAQLQLSPWLFEQGERIGTLVDGVFSPIQPGGS
jgi:uncharacterized protein